jgi:hypothetical protein
MAAALRAAAHDLILQSGYASRTAAQLRADAEAHEARAQGLRDAAAVITAAIEEDDQ